MLDDILLQVHKPGRYIGAEWNVSKKDFDTADIKFALCFPDLYEVGMSNLGIRILYGILNDLPDTVCERFFSPHLDMEEKLRSHRIEISSLESKKNLKDFDLVGFSLAHELDYTNVLNILELGGIPLQASLRDLSWPLVIGGGPCVFNPEPMHDFFDMFVIGEAEEAVLGILKTYRELKNRIKAKRIDKIAALAAFSRIEGVYVPSLYEVSYDATGKIVTRKPRTGEAPPQVKKRFVKDLNNAYFPQGWLVPYIQIVHDRVTLEVMRGCPNACRFCQARLQYFPFRTKDPGTICQFAIKAYEKTGYEEIALGGLSVSDHPQLKEFLVPLIDYFKTKGVSISLPSIKPKAMLGDLSSLIATIKKTSLTFAPEAATEKLRKVLAKHFDSRDFSSTIEQAYRIGYRHIKLYFMVGLPQETWEDLDAIIEFAITASELRRKITGKPSAQINLSVNTLIPKPHTPLQWLRMHNPEEIEKKQMYLRQKTSGHKKLKLNFHNPRMTLLEGIVSRGDRRLAQVIAAAYAKGARFDAWDDYFKFDLWLSAFEEAGIDPFFYLQARNGDEILPWDFIDVGIRKEELLSEFNKAVDIG